MNNIEIERKYLVHNDTYKDKAVCIKHLCQAYLSTEKSCVVRVRIADECAYLTIKGNNADGGIEHFEWEKEISVDDAKALMDFAGARKIEKDRYIVPYGELTIEVDVFHGENEGLVVAEIELPYADYPLMNMPDFIGMEVTDDRRYYNSYLSSNPYSEWK